MRTLIFGNRVIGDGFPAYVVAEIGINHNGSIDIAKRLIDAAANAKCDAVKFQKRTPELCVPAHQRDQRRSTPWGEMSYLEYRRRMEFGIEEYEQLVEHCRSRSIDRTLPRPVTSRSRNSSVSGLAGPTPRTRANVRPFACGSPCSRTGRVGFHEIQYIAMTNASQVASWR